MVLAQKHRFRTNVRNRIILWANLVVNFGFHKIYHFAENQQKYPKYAKITENHQKSILNEIELRFIFGRNLREFNSKISWVPTHESNRIK